MPTTLVKNPTKNNQVHVHQLGLVGYRQVWDFQKELFDAVLEVKLANRQSEEKKPTPNHLVLCQHPPVYTLGKSGKQDNLLVNEGFLGKIGATYEKIERGGDITFHGPGQWVLYPILDLDNFGTDVHKFMRKLEELVIRCLAELGLEGKRLAGLTGVWLSDPQGERKICAMGVKLSRWVSMHGLALNVNTDLSYFQHIVPCGIQDKAVTSIQKELGKPADMERTGKSLLTHFGQVFEAELFAV